MLQELKNNLKNSVINISITVDSLGLFSGTFFQAGKKAASVVSLTEDEFKEELVYYINSTEEPTAQKSEKVKISTEKAKTKEAPKKAEKKAEEPNIDFDKDSKQEETGNIEATQETKKESEKLKEEPKVEKPKAPEKSAANDDDDFDF